MERAVAATGWEARHPAGIHAALAALAQGAAPQDSQRQALGGAREQARDDAPRARRPYAVAAPAPRVGAGA